ncbi:hypothetical protein DL771_008633 [Monosporascus sp. 5C6A]|nr:hypothetical protein DL771_008633 [Monosporascus sp. 5C6A]
MPPPMLSWMPLLANILSRRIGYVAERIGVAKAMAIVYMDHKVLREDGLHFMLKCACTPRLRITSLWETQIIGAVTTPAHIERGDVAKGHRWMRIPVFRHLYQMEKDLDKTTATVGDRHGWAAGIVTQPPAKRLARSLAVPPEDINTNKPPYALGVDPPVTIQLLFWFSNEIRAEMPVVQILGSSSIAQLDRIAVPRVTIPGADVPGTIHLLDDANGGDPGRQQHIVVLQPRPSSDPKDSPNWARRRSCSPSARCTSQYEYWRRQGYVHRSLLGALAAPVKVLPKVSIPDLFFTHKRHASMTLYAFILLHGGDHVLRDDVEGEHADRMENEDKDEKQSSAVPVAARGGQSDASSSQPPKHYPPPPRSYAAKLWLFEEPDRRSMPKQAPLKSWGAVVIFAYSRAFLGQACYTAGT